MKTVAYHSPMPPARTGVAGYSEGLVRALRQLVRVEVNPSSDSAGEPVYHIGNNHLHRDIYQRSLHQPGTVVLHDAVLHHFFLGFGDERAYVDEFVHNYGEWHRGFATELWRRRRHSAQDPVFFAYPMLRRVAEAARTVVVHNPAAARMASEHAPAARVVEIPHLFEAPDPPPGYAIARLRQDLGAGAVVFGVFGHLRESKRVPVIVRAFTRLYRDYPQARLVVAGEFVSSDLARAVDPMLSAPGILRLPYLSERDFWLWAHTIDTCINLRYPRAGETSGITLRFAGIGKCVLVTAGEEMARWPDTTCLRVDAGLSESEMIEEYMRWLCQCPQAASEIGLQAMAHVRRYHTPAIAARELLSTLCDDANHRADRTA